MTSCTLRVQWLVSVLLASLTLCSAQWQGKLFNYQLQTVFNIQTDVIPVSATLQGGSSTPWICCCTRIFTCRASTTVVLGMFALHSCNSGSTEASTRLGAPYLLLHTGRAGLLHRPLRQ